MGFHDDIANKARRAGETEAQFRAAAQGHANGTWLWLAVAGAVWYFTTWWWALIAAAVAVFKAVQCISATAVANRLASLEADRG